MTTLADTTAQTLNPQLIDAIIAGPSVGLAITLTILFMDRTTHKKEREALLSDLEKERERNNAFGQAWMELATETKIHLQGAPGAFEKVSSLVKEEHVKTREDVVKGVKDVIRE